jgi:hypothetical protein
MLDSSRIGTVPVAPVSASVWQGAATRVLVPLFAATLFLSSFLMFTVEPMVARQMLPVLGGVPMVWNGCVVFFQAVLLAGYGGAHIFTRRLAAPVRLLVYAGLAVAPLALVRLGVDAASASHASDAPRMWLLGALLTSVGPLFFMLAISASLLQATFAATRHASARDPYFLYAASNTGSLVALIAYPTVVEPLLGLSRQARVWTIGYGGFVLLVLACAVAARFSLRGGAAATAPDAAEAAAPAADAADIITWTRRARWCVLAAVPSSLMLGVTTALTTDLSPVPLLWVGPLMLYLVTFGVAFSRGGARQTRLAGALLPVLLLGVAASLLTGHRPPIGIALLVHLVPFFAAAMLCHGTLAQDRPSARHLTEFYFWLAFGGMVGGLFNTLAAPLLFSRVLEYPIALAAVAFLRPQDPAHRARRAVDYLLPIAAAAIVAVLVWQLELPRSPTLLCALTLCAGLTLLRRHQVFTVAAVTGVFLIASPWTRLAGETPLHMERTFFGAYRVTLDGSRQYRMLSNGTTMHGLQSVQRRRYPVPLSYYHLTGPFGQMMTAVPRLNEPGEVAAIGLGVGSLGAYARPGQRWTFYEIDPAVERIARNESYFTFLRDCGDKCRVVIGDARLSLTRTQAQYQLIVVDAFSSDAIPVHLITQEAMALYLARLAPHGVLAFHISNRHLVLGGIIAKLAESNCLAPRFTRDVETAGRRFPPGKVASQWVMMARSAEDLGALIGARNWVTPRSLPSTSLWTDDFSNIFEVLALGWE